LNQTHIIDNNHSTDTPQSQLLCLTTNDHKHIAYLHGDSNGQLTVWQNAINYAMRTTVSHQST
jgi:hypothetical protein